MLPRMADLLQSVEIETGRPVRAAVIWLHGLGADGHDFEPIVPYLGTGDLGVRFVFPHAPRRAVTINMGLIMPAWYDIRGLEAGTGVDERGSAPRPPRSRRSSGARRGAACRRRVSSSPASPRGA